MHAHEDDDKHLNSWEYLRKLQACILPDIRPLFKSNAIHIEKARKDLLGNIKVGIQHKSTSASQLVPERQGKFGWEMYGRRSIRTTSNHLALLA